MTEALLPWAFVGALFAEAIEHDDPASWEELLYTESQITPNKTSSPRNKNRIAVEV